MASLILGVCFIGSAWLTRNSFMVYSTVDIELNDEKEISQFNKCKENCRPFGSESLPKGIVSTTSNFEMRPLWGPVSENYEPKGSTNLLAIAVGIKQKESVNKIVSKFLANGFAVMAFHYDGVVDEWKGFGWHDKVIHVSAPSQTKMWFAKRFLHPDIVSEYDYIFLWDEDLGVENFIPRRYLSIVRQEGLEISQPALDPRKSKVHHRITARMRGSKFHRRYYDSRGGGKCDNNSTGPPCAGWVEMMAPVYSKAAWRCAWYMIQNDLIHGWGLDMQLGYCAQVNSSLELTVLFCLEALINSVYHRGIGQLKLVWSMQSM
ncbi:uncharacterized protein LOC111375862 isoform X2 [Olea europaea subsp. europaea]|uniref:Uncharacterized protein LOC111375862 isoform X2 n=1 Tax=Olea europaea subsp. europaea TaxID=158383 RepID=A0A8S0P9K3_OLEEU|nr:uncharacterized protein LOC111375862 isoform X2 [Olea europaea subsp. europaea]